MSEVALWWVRYHSPEYEICEGERDAAGRAWGIQDSGGGSVLGIQFPDGRTVARDDWEMLRQVTAEYEAAIAARPAPSSRPVRKILDPFGKWPLEVDEGEPSWLGQPVSAAR